MNAVVLKDSPGKGWSRPWKTFENGHVVRPGLRRAGIPHVVVGGNAVAAWVARVDQEAVRNTKDVDLLVRREDFARIAELRSVGFIRQNVAGVDLFLDGPQGSVRSAIHVLFAGEKVRPGLSSSGPRLSESQGGPSFRAHAGGPGPHEADLLSPENQVHLSTCWRSG